MFRDVKHKLLSRFHGLLSSLRWHHIRWIMEMFIDGAQNGKERKNRSVSWHLLSSVGILLFHLSASEYFKFAIFSGFIDRTREDKASAYHSNVLEMWLMEKIEFESAIEVDCNSICIHQERLQHFNQIRLFFFVRMETRKRKRRRKCFEINFDLMQRRVSLL